MACAIDLVIVGVLIMAPNTWASPTTSGSAATWPRLASLQKIVLAVWQFS
jgi:hypothetical protein